jgi:hypothetical protein
MTMYDAPSDRDYAEWLNPSEREEEEPEAEVKKSPARESAPVKENEAWAG